MADVVNRATKQYRRFVNTPDFDPADWIINPDLSAVQGWPTRYWEINGDIVTLADAATRAAIDAARIAVARDSVADELDDLQNVLVAFIRVLLDERNADAARFNALRDAVANASNLNDAKTAMQAIGDAPTRTLAQIKSAVRTKLDG